MSSSLDSLSGGECEMAPHSPVRGAGAGPPHAPPPPYVAPPPAYPPPHHHQWPVAPPNVYVSQVTANVNVHGYMGQYYQPQPQYAPPPQVWIMIIRLCNTLANKYLCHLTGKHY